MKPSVVSALIVACLPAAALAMDDHPVKQPDALKWTAAPPALPAGSEVAVLYGDPSSSGPYALRVRMPADYKVPPHTHPTAENVTVISGTLNVGMGATLDTAKSEAMGPGAFARMDKGVQHYAFSSGPTIIQVNGMGPFEIMYVNPADDPRGMAAKAPAESTTGSK
jgi:quercetin dioxygenase-like cupin family protein